MKVKCIDNYGRSKDLVIGKIYEVLDIDTFEEWYYIKSETNDKDNFAFYRFEVIEEPKQIIDINGIQTEPFTHEEKKVIAVEKDIAKCEVWKQLLDKFRIANDLQRIALLEIFEEMNYPKTDMVKLYRVIADES